MTMKTLSFEKETVRDLVSTELDAVAGGAAVGTATSTVYQPHPILQPGTATSTVYQPHPILQPGTATSTVYQPHPVVPTKTLKEPLSNPR
jgi:hypothetical protein